MEVEFLSQVRYNLYVSPPQWEVWKVMICNMYLYHRDCVRQKSISKKPFYPSIPSPPISTIPTSPSFSETSTYPPMPSSPFRMHFAQQPASERIPSPRRALPPMDDSPAAASAAIHARISRKRSREENSALSGLQPPAKRQQQYPGPLGIPAPIQQSQRIHYPMDTIQHSLQQQQQQQRQRYNQKQPRVGLSLSLPDSIHSPSRLTHHQTQTYSLQATSPSYPTSPYAGSPISPFSTTSNYNSHSPYTVPPHRPNQSTPQPSLLESQPPIGHASGISSPYKYLQNRASPYAPVRPARTLPSQFVPPRMQWSVVPSNEELWYQPLGMHGHSGLRRGIPTYPDYNPGYSQYRALPPPPPQRQNQSQR